MRGQVKTPPFGPDARIEAGFFLRRLQRGEFLGLPQLMLHHPAEHRQPLATLVEEDCVRADRRRKLERAGWTVGDAGDFLSLSVDERRFVEVKLAMAAGLRRRREQLGLTQAQVAERFGTSQSRVAKMEAADRTVTTDLLLKSLFRLGASPRDVSRLLIPKTRSHAA